MYPSGKNKTPSIELHYTLHELPCHLHVLVARCLRRRRRRSVPGRLLRDHRFQEWVDLLVLEDPERRLRVHLVLARRAYDADRGVVHVELFVLLQCLAQRVQAVAD